jgi:hypothetical protein
MRRTATPLRSCADTSPGCAPDSKPGSGWTGNMRMRIRSWNIRPESPSQPRSAVSGAFLHAFRERSARILNLVTGRTPCGRPPVSRHPAAERPSPSCAGTAGSGKRQSDPTSIRPPGGRLRHPAPSPPDSVGFAGMSPRDSPDWRGFTAHRTSGQAECPGYSRPDARTPRREEVIQTSSLRSASTGNAIDEDLQHEGFFSTENCSVLHADRSGIIYKNHFNSHS